jgi:hypothetical protein
MQTKIQPPDIGDSFLGMLPLKYSDIAGLLCRKYLNQRSKDILMFMNKAWFNFLKRKIHQCQLHFYHCKFCRTRISGGCVNKRILCCLTCVNNFCAHIQKKTCKKCGWYMITQSNITKCCFMCHICDKCKTCGWNIKTNQTPCHCKPVKKTQTKPKLIKRKVIKRKVRK